MRRPLLHRLLAAALLCAAGIARAQDYASCPGVILSEITSWYVYTSDPCILVLSNGDYLASHAQFGALSGSDSSGRTKIFRSSDKGVTWTKVNGGNDITGILRGSLFEHDGAIYMLGSNHDDEGSTAVMLKSTNNGNSWSKVSFSPMSGMATPDNVVPFNGRLWLTGGRSSVSAPASGADLFASSSWSVIGGFPTPQNSWLPGTGFNTDDNYIGEGVTAVSATGVSSLAKVRMLPYFTVSSVNPTTGTVYFDPDHDFIPMPGGEKKFGVRYDGVSGKYFMLANPILAAHLNSGIAVDLVRNTAAVYSSKDRRNWRVEKIFLYSPNIDYEGFQYLNFDFDGDDMVVASRTAFDVGNGKPPRGHDSNLLTFHRIPDFRNLTRDHVLKLESGVAKRYEKTQHKDAPLGNFALGTSFAGAALTSLNGFAQSGGEVYLRETGGRILKFDLAGNFLAVTGSAPVAFQTSTLSLPAPPEGRSTWVASGSGSWDEPRNWHYFNRPGTGEDTAVFGSSVTGANATITVPSIARRWDFNTAGDFQGWTLNVAATNPQVTGGVLKATFSSANATGVTVQRVNQNFPGDLAPQVRVRMKAATAETVGVRFYWGTMTNNSFAAARRIDVNYTGNGQFQDLVFDPSAHAEWAGQTITRIRVDPLNGSAFDGVAFEIDWVEVPVDSDARALAGMAFYGPAAYTLGGDGALRLRPAAGEGRLDVFQGNHTVAVPLDIDADSVASVGSGASLSVSGVLSGAGNGTLAKEGNGTLTLLGNNTFGGVVEARGGTLALGRSGGTLADGSTLSVNGGTIRVDQNDTVGTFRRVLMGALTGAGQITSGAYEFAHPSGTATFGQGGVGTEVLWSGPLVKSGASTLVVVDSPSYAGGTTIREGVLQVGNGGASGMLPGDVANDGVLRFDRSDSFTFPGLVSGAGTLEKSGAGTMILTANQTFTGDTVIGAGTLQLGNNSTAGSLAGDIVNGGVLSINRSNDVTLAGTISGNGSVVKSGNGKLTLTGNNTFAGGIVNLSTGSIEATRNNAFGTGPITIQSTGGIGASGTYVVLPNDLILNGTPNTNMLSSGMTFTGNVSGSGGLSFNGFTAGILGFTNNNTGWSGNLTSTGGAQLRLGHPKAIGNGTLSFGSAITSLALPSMSSSADLSAGDGVANNIVNNTAGTVFYLDNPLKLSGVISGPGSIRIGTGSNATLFLTNNNTYTGFTNLQDGSLSVARIGNGGEPGNIGAASNAATNLVFSKGTLRYTGVGESTDRLFTIGSASSNYTATGTPSVDLTATVTGTIDSSGSGPLVFANTGNLTVGNALDTVLHLTGSNTGDNTLAAAIADSTDSAAVVLSNCTTSSQTNGSANRQIIVPDSTGILVGDAVSGAGIPANATVTAVLGATRIAIQGGATLTQSGNATLTFTNPDVSLNKTRLLKSGNGTWVLAGNASYTGGTTIAEGTLRVGAGSTAGTIPGDVANEGVLHFNRSDSFTYPGAISGNGNVRKSGAGTLILAGANTHTGGTAIEGGTLQVGDGATGSLAGNVTNNGTLVFGRNNTITFDGDISGPGGLQKSNAGGTVILTGNSSFTGPVSALRSTLRVSSINSVSGGAPTSNLGAPTTAANGTISLGTGTQFASLVYDGAGETTDRVIRLAGTSGTGITLTQEGAGLLKFTSALAFANNAASYTLRLNGSTAGAGEFAGNITNGSGGAKSLKKEGTGTWTLSGNLSYAGNTTVSGGRLVVKKLGFADASAVSVAAGAFLQLDHGATDTVGELWVAGEQKWKGTWGGVGSSAPYQTEAIEGSGLLLVTAGPEPPLTGFPAWADDSGLTGEPGFENGASDDPESDGLPNLIEWVLGGDPLGADAASRSPSVGWHDADTISFEFARSDDSESGAAVFVEYSVSLGSGVWTRVPVGATGSTASGGVSVEVEENGEAADSVRVLLPEALAPDGRFFVRLVSEVVGGP